MASFLYVFLRSKNWLKSIIFPFLVYSLIFSFCAAPFFVKCIIETQGIKFIYSDMLFAKVYLFLIFFLASYMFYIYERRYFLEIIKDVRPFRLLHFELMFILGIALGFNHTKTFQLADDSLFNLFFIIVSIACAWIFSVITNNIIDKDTDIISNKNRPSVSNNIPPDVYKTLAVIFVIFSLFYSFAVSFISFFLIVLFIGNYFMYSMPPLRLKTIPFFSKMAISLNSLILVMLGYWLMTDSIKVSSEIVALFLIGFTAAINFVDIKDYEGDKKAKIKTLPTIFGVKKSKLIIGSFFLILYPSVYFLTNNIYLLIPLIIFGATQFVLITKGRYNEQAIFSVYLFSITLLITYVFMFGI